ncbi:MAG: hypothetical protein ACR2H2_03055 [Solirubrobacteraceae bacterium]
MDDDHQLTSTNEGAPIVKFERRKSQSDYWRIEASKSRVLVGGSRAIALTATLAVVGATTLLAGAPAVSPQGQISSFQMLVSGPDGNNVLDIRGNLTPSMISHGTVKISPKLCERDYQLHLAFTGPGGRVVGDQRYDAKVHGARLDGRPQRCPYSGLPRRGLRSFQVLATLNGEKLMTFKARPRTRAGETFNRLSTPRLRYYSLATLSGRARIRVRARYRTGRVHVATFRADIAAAPTVLGDSS